MLREVKFYARDILRGPNATSLPGFFAFTIVASFAVGAVLGLAIFGVVTLLRT